MVKLCNVANAFEADQIVALLMDNGIQAYKQGVGAGGYSQITAGVSAMGYDIMVDEDKVQQAIELVRPLVGIEKEEEPQGGIPWARIGAIIMLIVVVLAVVSVFFR